eukprot:m.239696 g.239696  ORF g.239696 m.239696 type:complete len:479 (-) comp13974_c0_seq1:1007-2443(-)
MLSAATKERRDAQGLFLTNYLSICRQRGLCPITAMHAHRARVSNSSLSLKVDRLQHHEWEPILQSLKKNVSLTRISLYSEWFSAQRRVTRERSRMSARKRGKSKHSYRNRNDLLAPHLLNPPPIHEGPAVIELCRVLKILLSRNDQLKHLELNGIPLSSRALRILADGVASSSLETLMVVDAMTDDVGIRILSDGVQVCSSLRVLSLKYNLFTSRGLRYVLDVLRSQSALRGASAWETSLRGRVPDMVAHKGILALDLSYNEYLGDDGVKEVYDTLLDNTWLLSLSLRCCGLTDSCSQSLHALFKRNETLLECDLSGNQLSGNTLGFVKKCISFNKGEIMKRPGDEFQRAAQVHWRTMKEDLTLVDKMAERRKKKRRQEMQRFGGRRQEFVTFENLTDRLRAERQHTAEADEKRIRNVSHRRYGRESKGATANNKKGRKKKTKKKSIAKHLFLFFTLCPRVVTEAPRKKKREESWKIF